MIHRRHFDPGPLERAKTAFDYHESLVAAGGIFKADGIVVGFDYPFAIILDRITNGSPVNANESGFGDSQVSLETTRCQQFNGPLGCRRLILVSAELIFEKFNDLFAMLFLSFGFFGVLAQDITLSSFTVTDDDLLGMQVVVKDGITAPFTENLTFNFGNVCHTAG